ncbi:hypothetical protein PHYBOEH_005229 [Phytophthora boehmeriae]|uniref:RxLR effector protein n=1 Tax=Phytophthora boehmeriae TaxID=109152 RepID=A0A8T1WLT7_9STRA|nr:hypothetical protein PHYBOEH_005229 [Phytophthora boehmeriae]
MSKIFILFVPVVAAIWIDLTAASLPAPRHLREDAERVAVTAHPCTMSPLNSSSADVGGTDDHSLHESGTMQIGNRVFKTVNKGEEEEESAATPANTIGGDAINVAGTILNRES